MYTIDERGSTNVYQRVADTAIRESGTHERSKPSGAMTLFAMVIVPTGPTVFAKIVVADMKRKPNSRLRGILYGPAKCLLLV